jgi:hypothetical protein
MAIEDFGPGMKFTAKIAVAFVYITQKRINPKYTIEDARKVKLAEFDVDVPPTEQAALTTP